MVFLRRFAAAQEADPVNALLSAEAASLPSMDEWEALLVAMRSSQQMETIDVWFRRCIDRDRGGLNCDFDSRWALT